MPLDNTDVAALSTLAGLAPLQPTDIVAVYRPGSPTPLQTARVSDIGAALGGAMTIESQGAMTTTTPISLNFTSGLTVTDDGHGAETIASCFASVKDFGAKGDGTTNDVAAFTAAAGAGVTVFIPPGTYKLSSSVTFPGPVVFLAGAVIAPASATTTTFNGGIVAPLTAIFSLTGSAAIAFTPATQLTAYAEWWGAVTYGAGAYPVSSPTYSDVAIQAAVNAGAASVQLMGADYYIAAAISILTSNFTLQGVASNQSGSAGGTRLVIKSATIDGVTIGPASQPGGGVTTWLEHVTARRFTVIRSVAPTSIQNTSGFNGYLASPAGVRMRYVTNSYLEDIVSIDHSSGFYFTGAIYCKATDCKAERTQAPNGSGWDFYFGYAIDSSPTISGYVTGNASIYIHRCSAFGAGSGAVFPGGTGTTGGAGAETFGACTDLFFHAFECGGLANGIVANGGGTSGGLYTAEDLRVINCVLDGIFNYGILINSCDYTGATIIAGNYVQTTGGADGIAVKSNNGLVSITGNQVLSVSGNTGTGITAVSTSGVSSMNNMIVDFKNAVVFDGSTECRSEDIISNNFVNANAGVYLANSCARCVVRPMQKGNGAGTGGIGIKVDSAVGYCSVDPSGIDPGCLTSGSSANKIVYNGTQITSTGAFGTTNLASGIMN